MGCSCFRSMGNARFQVNHLPFDDIVPIKTGKILDLRVWCFIQDLYVWVIELKNVLRPCTNANIIRCFLIANGGDDTTAALSDRPSGQILSTLSGRWKKVVSVKFVADKEHFRESGGDKPEI
ncbi:PREDICTED: uncharacterized protein LOC104826096 isoform X2 [Tarenaya hassleriana]|uniref:uncharacterized protein LOC104826096 isoform X2 n=1 Tax=Tarenaya hassleriana TaxID=28532 RepID=UPI00053C93E2|nr:PREDICTED: uncharacterized protein LOC104826096 isoform X2 [Tarenaya hassleriana]